MTTRSAEKTSSTPALIRSVIDAFKIPDLRFKILFTFAILVLFRFLAHVPVPGVDREALAAAFDSAPILGFLDLFSGGALRNLSIAALGVYPYITASIIMQVITPVIPSLKELSQEGQFGRQKVNQYTHYLMIPIAFLQGWGQISILQSSFGGQVIEGSTFGGGNFLSFTSILLTMTAGTALLVWLGELVTEKGIGNGISLIIFAGIVSSLPSIIGQGILISDQFFQLSLLVIIALLIVYLIVVFNEAQRRVPVQYGRSVFRQGRMYKQTGGSFIPLRVNSAGMIPLIFAFSLLILPASISGYFVDPSTNSTGSQIAEAITNFLSPTNATYWILVFIMVMLFTFFYSIVTFNQQNVSDNLQKNGGFIPGIRPGSPTQSFLSQVMIRITWGGAIFLGFVAVIPFIAGIITNVGTASTIMSSTSLLIMVGVALDTMRQLESQLLMRNYDGFLKE
jgi:preprotein translocase subunit SecY